MNTNAWCWIGFAVCYGVTVALALAELTRTNVRVNELETLREDLEDDLRESYGIRRAIIDERNELRARLTRTNPRDGRGRFSA